MKVSQADASLYLCAVQHQSSRLAVGQEQSLLLPCVTSALIQLQQWETQLLLLCSSAGVK